MEKAFRKTGIDIIGDVPWGTHLCQFYQTKKDLIDILVPYFKVGLENNEFCMWITSEPLKVEDAKAAIKKVVKNLDHFIKKGQIEILDYSEWYTKSGKFNANKALQDWVEKENQALKRGYDGLRLSGNTSWLEESVWKNFTDYEEEVNKVIGKYRMIAICAYFLGKCKASEVVDVVSNHRFALIRREGEWVIIESSEYKRVEEELRVSEERYRTILDNIEYGYFEVDIAGNFTFFNDSVCIILGYSRDEMMGMNNRQYMDEESAKKTYQAFNRVYTTGQPYIALDWEIIRKDGAKRFVESLVSLIKDSKGEGIGFRGIGRDITERKRVEAEIKKLNEELERRVIERTAQLEAINKELQKEISERKQVEEELRNYRDHLEEMIKERTQRIQELESQRGEIEKLAAKGLMAADIAHEINNPLAGIKNSLLLVKDAVPRDHPHYQYIGLIEKEVSRIAQTVRQMFGLYHPDQEIKKEFMLDKTIYDVVALLGTVWQENSVEIQVDTKSIMMEMPEGLFRQILYNILMNAIEASPRGGVVKIMTEVNDEMLTVSISDQGTGIPFEARSRIFEPFFTTKHGNKGGLGLGLSISKEIVEKLGGHINFESETEKETVFRIILPIKSGGEVVEHG